jgi:hypothetical protein
MGSLFVGNKLPTLLFILLTQPIQADYQSGLDAYNNDDYKKARYDWIAVITTSPGKVTPATRAESNYAIGMLYWMGQGVPASYQDASKWLFRAAEMGHAGAQGKLGYLYTQGITVPQNYETAFQWFSKAAEQGDIDGQYNLGNFYLNGWGTEPDKTMATQYLTAASAQGDKDAELALKNLSQSPPGSKVNLAQARASTKTTNPNNTHRHPGEGRDRHDPAPTQPPINPPTWILNQNPNHYTIQVIALRSRQSLENLIESQQNLSPFAIYAQQKDKPLHILIQGVYPDLESVREAKNNFPTAIQPPENVWIRKFGKIQELIGPH